MKSSSSSAGHGLSRSVWPCALVVAGLGPALVLSGVRGPVMASGAQVPPARGPAVDAPALDGRIKALLEAHGDGIKASVWFGGPTGAAWYSWQPDEIRPTASAVKTAFLVELFARYADGLDRPPPGLDEILREGSPAFRHYSPAERNKVRQALAGRSVRELGQVMMGSDPESVIVYNAAANVVIALFGGPDGLTRTIRARDGAFAPIAVRRYMLAPRNVTGDNEATAASLAAVLQRLASSRIPGVAEATAAGIRKAMLVKDLEGKGRYHFKSGDLDSDPLARIQSGWLETPDGRVVVCVVMVTQPSPGSFPRARAGARLETTARRITETLFDLVPARDAP